MTTAHPSRNCLLKCAALLGAAAAILAACGWAWLMVKEHDALRIECLLAAIVSGLGATICLAGVIHYLDILSTADNFKWHGRALLAITKRVILLLQFATTGLALAAAGILIFGFKIPGVHATMG